MKTNQAKNPEKSRQKLIIKAASKLFMEKGYHASTVREIARESGITVGTLYHYIKSKEDIFPLVQRDMDALRDEVNRKSNDALKRMGPVEALRLAIRGHFTYCHEVQDMIIFWFRETGNMPSETRKTLLANTVKNAEIIGNILRTGIKAGDFRKHDTVLMAHNIMMLGNMWPLRRWFLRDRYTIKQYINKQTKTILAAISPNEGLRLYK